MLCGRRKGNVKPIGIQVQKSIHYDAKCYIIVIVYIIAQKVHARSNNYS